MKRAAEMEKKRRIAADEVLDMPNLEAQEKASMQTLLERYGLKEEAVRPDGNCLYAAFARQLSGAGPTTVLKCQIAANVYSTIQHRYAVRQRRLYGKTERILSLFCTLMIIRTPKTSIPIAKKSKRLPFGVVS
jgi:hypothetical protein